MFEKELTIDGKKFSKDHVISAKRPTNYWLLFIKRFVLTYKEPWFKPYYLIFAIPIVLILLLVVFGADFESIFPVFFVSIFVTIFIFGIIYTKIGKPFVPINEFHDLAKFIISIKGDIYRNRFSLKLNTASIEKRVNLLDPNKIGLVKRRKTTYKPYQIERFKANFILKDGSVCNIVLQQFTLRISRWKRGSSGKMKLKTKRKHKLFYLLSLKLKDEDYNVYNAEPAIMNTNRFDIVLQTENGFHYVKVKAKVKSLDLETKLKTNREHKPSIYTEMMDYLKEQKIISRTNAKQLTP